MVTVWQRLKQDTGLDISAATFRRYVHAVMPEAVGRVTVTVWRPEVVPMNGHIEAEDRRWKVAQ